VKKPPGTAVDPRNGGKYELQSVTKKPLELPDDVRKSLRHEAIIRWQEFTSSPVARVLDPTDYLIAIRWIEAVNRSIKLTREADEEPVTTGSAGQLIMNPKYRIAEAATVIAEKCERQLGIGPKNRADLGVQLIDAKPSLDAMNEQFKAEDEEVDPRLIQGE
jgi:hypothetical protein